VCNFECLSVADVRALIAVGSVQSSLYVEMLGGGGGRLSATHCMPANGEEYRNVHEVRSRRCWCVHCHEHFTHERIQIRQRP
jgi:nitrate reductase cytochrome c-type subunit